MGWGGAGWGGVGLGGAGASSIGGRRSGVPRVGRQDILNFVGIMPFAVSDWDMVWLPSVITYESCPEGRGQVAHEWPVHVVAQVGRVAERARFARRYGREAARTSTMRRLDPLKDGETVISSALSFNALEPDWDVGVNFPELPARWMFQDWRVLRSRRWKWDDKVHIGDACSAVQAAAAFAAAGASSRRCLRVGDHLGVLLALERERAADFCLLASVRRSWVRTSFSQTGGSHQS